jgi:hypothetical protein
MTFSLGAFEGILSIWPLQVWKEKLPRSATVARCGVAAVVRPLDVGVLRQREEGRGSGQLNAWALGNGKWVTPFF